MCGFVCECVCVYAHDTEMVVKGVHLGPFGKLPGAQVSIFSLKLTVGGKYILSLKWCLRPILDKEFYLLFISVECLLPTVPRYFCHSWHMHFHLFFLGTAEALLPYAKCQRTSLPSQGGYVFELSSGSSNFCVMALICHLSDNAP